MIGFQMGRSSQLASRIGVGRGGIVRDHFPSLFGSGGAFGMPSPGRNGVGIQEFKTPDRPPFPPTVPSATTGRRDGKGISYYLSHPRGDGPRSKPYLSVTPVD